MKPIFVLALAASLPTAAMAFDKPHNDVSGVGAITCGRLTSDYHQQPQKVEEMMMIWAQGFMTGSNVMGPDDKDLTAMSTDEQTQRLLAYCNEHPSADFVGAARDLYLKLPAMPVETK
jgi:HdeA/HdeB family